VRIALVTNRFPILSETFIYNHAAGLRAAGFDVTVVATTPVDDPYHVDDSAMFQQLGGPQFEGPIRHVVLARGLAQTARNAASRLLGASARDLALWDAARARFGRSRRAIRAWMYALSLADFEVVHFEYSGLAISFVDAIPLLAPARVFVSCRGSAERITPLLVPTRANELREMFALVDRVHCVSADMLRTCESYGLDRAKAFVNHPAVVAERFTRTTPRAMRTTGPYRLVSTGRLIWAKGLEFALLAVREVLDRGYDVRYEIIGSGPEEERLRYAVHDLRLEKHVTLTGRLSPAEVRAVLDDADLYLLPSVSEGMSNAALEAMAMQLPVISTTAGGMAEAISDGVDGVLVPSRAPHEMARAIETLLEAPARREELGRAARQRIEREFSLERQIAVFVAAYGAT